MLSAEIFTQHANRYIQVRSNISFDDVRDNTKLFWFDKFVILNQGATWLNTFIISP